MCYVMCDIVVQAERCHRITAILQKLQDQNKLSNSSSTPTTLPPPPPDPHIDTDTDPDPSHILALEAQLRASKVLLLREVLCLLPAFAWSWPDFGTNPKVPRRVINVLMWLESMVAYSARVGANSS
jgi:hypothetical protein